MKQEEIKEDKVREDLADLCHRQWAGWMSYLFSRSRKTADGEVIIPAELVARWERQVGTDYSALPFEEQESDRKEADRFLDLLGIS